MNGWTKTVSIALSILVLFCGIAFGYGTLNNRVLSNENKIKCIQEIRDRVISIEADVKWIKSKT